MKLSNINEALKSFDGQDIIIPIEGKEPSAFTIKTAILNCLGAKAPKDGKESIAIYRLGCKLFDGADEVDMDELLLLKAAVEENKPGYTGMIHGQLLMFLEN